MADLTRGEGHYNLALGILATMQGIGASLSNFISGFIVEWAGFNAAFYTLSVIALIALLLFFFTIPETKATNLDPITDSHGY